MSFQEYLYVDDKRLDRYADGIGSPLIFEKVAALTVRISLLPEAGATQERASRPLTRPEKIDRLLEFLRKHKYLDEGRFKGREALSPDAKMFRLETCHAVKVHIPAASPEMLVPKEIEDDLDLPVSQFLRLAEQLAEQKRQECVRAKKRLELLKHAREQLEGFEGINLWFSDRHHTGPSNPQEQGQLFLIVGFPRDDEPHFVDVSAYSALVGLFNELASEFRKSILFGISPAEVNSPGPSQFHQRFLSDPIETLRTAGARIAGWRAITTLYRVRDAILYTEPTDSVESTATIGYPIFISATGF